MARGAPALLRLIRLPGCLTASADSMTAFLVATTVLGHTVDTGDLALAAVASFALYAFGIVLGDLLDVEKDRRLHPGRPLPAGDVPPERARALAAVLLLTGLVAAAAVGITTLVFAGLTAIAIVLHQRILRRSDLLASIGMATCRVLNLYLGAAAAGGVGGLPGLVVAATGLYVFSLTGISAFEERRSPRRLLSLLVVLLLTSILLPFPAFPHRGFALAAACPLFLVLNWRAARARFETRPETVGALVGRAVTGLLLLDATFLLGFGYAGVAAGLFVLYIVIRLVRRIGMAT